MRMYDVIHNKRNGEELSDEEIKFFVDGYTAGSIPDYQAAALAMAIYFRGMSDRETVCLTKCIAESGDTVDLSRFGTLSVDKHSTGGVGDKKSQKCRAEGSVIRAVRLINSNRYPVTERQFLPKSF